MPSILERTADFFFGTKADPGSGTINPPTSSPSEIRNDIAAGQDTAGEAVNRVNALQVSVVAACARVIAEGLAQVSCRVMREDARGSLVEARDHPLFRLLNRRPNDWQTSFELREQIGTHLVLTNNAYVYINRVGGQVTELYAFTPESVEVKQAADLSLSYKVRTSGGASINVPPSDMWHLRGPSWNGFQGDDAITRAKRTIGLALATEKYGAKLFENGAKPGAIITTRTGAQPLTPEQRQQIRTMWSQQHAGAGNAHKTVILPFDLEVATVASTANDAQWIESRRFLIEEVCRFFRVLPIMVGQTGATSYASVEQLFLSHITNTLMPWFERFEQSAEAALLTPEEIEQGVCVKLNANGLLRGSTAERTAYFNAMVTLGVMTTNEVRAREDLPLSDDPEADKLRGAANLFGSQPTPPNDPTAAQTAPSSEGNDEVAE